MKWTASALLAAACLLGCGAAPEPPTTTVRTRSITQPPSSGSAARDEPAPGLVDERASPPATPDVFRLPTSGIRVVYRHRGGIPRVTLSVLLQTDPDDSHAIRALYGGLLLQATGDVDTASWLRDLGVIVGRRPGPNGELLTVTTVAPLFDAVAEHVGANVTTPVLGGPRVAYARAGVRLAHELRQRRPSTRALAAATGALLPGARYDVWYAASTPAEIDAINLDQLRSFHAKTAVSERIVLSVVGAISRDEVERVLDRAFRGVQHGASVRDPVVPPEAPPRSQVIVLDDPHVGEARVLCALRGPDPHSEDATLARATAAAWSRGVFGSLRLRHGASYVADSYWLPLRGASLLSAEASVAPSDAGLAVRSMKESFERRATFAAAAPAAREREQEAADDALDTALGLRSRPNAAGASPRLDVSRAVFVVVGDARAVGPSLAAAGIPFEVQPPDRGVR